MRSLPSALYLFVVFTVTRGADATEPVKVRRENYTARLKLKECDPKAGNAKGKAVDLTKITMPVNMRDPSFSFERGRGAVLDGELVILGTKCEMTLSGYDEKRIHVNIAIEQSNPIEHGDGTTTVATTRLNVDRTIEFGMVEMMDVPPDESGNRRWLELSVEPIEMP